MGLMKAFVTLLAAIGLAACAQTFEVAMPKDSWKEFASCMKEPSLTWTTGEGNKKSREFPIISIEGFTQESSGNNGDNLRALISASDTEKRSILQFAANLSAETDRSEPGVSPDFVNVFSIIRNGDDHEAPGSFSGLKSTAEAFVFGALNISASEKKKAVELAEQQVNEVAELLSSPTQKDLIAIQERLSSGDIKDQKIDVRISSKELHSYLDQMNRLTREGAWENFQTSAEFSFYKQSVAAAISGEKTSSGPEFKKLAGLYRDWKTAIFINAYLKAYFRNGKFASMKVDLASLEDAFPKADWNKLDEPIMAELKRILDKLTSEATFGRISEDGFVTRGGVTLQFPAVEISLNAAKRKIEVSNFDYVSVGGDIARVAIEAIFDSRLGLPAVSDATGVKLGGHSNADVLGLPDFEKLDAEKSIKVDGFAEVEEMSNKVDGTTSTLAGQLFRGAGPLALNNEALAHVLEVTIGTTSRKTSELVVWCREVARKEKKLDGLNHLPPDSLAKVRITIDGI